MSPRITKAERARLASEREAEDIKRRIAEDVARAKAEGVALEVANRIERGELFNDQYEADKVGRGFHTALAAELCKRGWKPFETHSRCKVAYGGEDHLEKDSTGVEMITSSLFGVFTIVHAFRKTW